MSPIYIGNSKDFEEGKGTSVFVGAVRCAVFRFQGELGCIRNECVHAGGPLCEGEVQSGKVICPWHKWEFDFKSGKGFGKECQGSFRIWEEGEKVFVDVDTPLHARVEYPCF